MKRLPFAMCADIVALCESNVTSAGDKDDLLKDPEIAKALSIVNAARKAAGVDEVQLSPTLTKGCMLHARYLILNHGNPLVAGLKAHEENESLQGYTKEGARA